MNQSFASRLARPLTRLIRIPHRSASSRPTPRLVLDRPLDGSVIGFTTAPGGGRRPAHRKTTKSPRKAPAATVPAPTAAGLRTLAEMAHLLGISSRLLAKQVKLGVVPTVRPTPGKRGIRYDAPAVMSSLGAKRVPAPGQPLPRFLSKTECASRIGVSPRSIDELVITNAIPFLKIGDRVVFNPLDVEDWLATRTT